MPIHFCPVCSNFLQMNFKIQTKDDENKLTYDCNVCGFTEEDTKGGMVLELNLTEKASEGYKILVNEFTINDKTLPHTDKIKCPNAECASVKGSAQSDVIFMKYDPVNLKYQYICTVCETSWRSK